MSRKDKEKTSKYDKERYFKYQEIVFDYYGHKCMWPEDCSITDSDMLQIDHINGNGNEHRKEIGNSNKLYQWLIKNNFPKGFRLLCANHNWEYRTKLQKEEWNSKSHSKESKIQKKYHTKLKEKILNYYDHKCQWSNMCNIVDSNILHIHHKNGGGNKNRKKIGNSYAINRDIIKNNLYNEFTIFCPNHHNKIHRQVDK